MNNEQLKKLHKKQIEILTIINEICQDNDIVYSLFGGSALGAIRHSGFIPWDDDFDIVMNRNNYIKFKQACKKQLPNNYFFQDFHTDRKYDQCFAKILDNNTAYIQGQVKDIVPLHKGIFVDIMVFDVVPCSKIGQLSQFIFASLNILFARNRVYYDGGLLLKIASKIILATVPNILKYNVRCFCEKQISKYKNIKEGYLATFITFEKLMIRYPINILDETIKVDFEEIKVPVFKNYEQYLKIEFGDYMKFPPISERRPKHNPIICDTKKSFREYEKLNSISN